MIPLCIPNLAGNEWEYVKDCLDTNWVSSVGGYVNKFEELAASFSGVEVAVATSNGTAALHLSLLLSGVTRNDLVILPNITFVAPANVIKYIGADPVLIDVFEDTWQLNVKLLRDFLFEECSLSQGECFHKESGRRVKAILPVHILGNMVDMDAIISLATQYNLSIIEDATEALGSMYKSRPAGSLGDFGCLSYNGNKIITTGGGGMVLTNDIEQGRKAKHLSTQAKSDPIEYFHDEVGYNYRLVNILAALGVAQMEQLPLFIEKKRAIATRYINALKSVGNFEPQSLTEGVEGNYWLFTAMFENSRKLFEYLTQKGIQTRPFWVPMNQLPTFSNCLYYTRTDVSRTIYENCLSLPCSTNLSVEQQDYVISSIKNFYA